MATYEVTVSRSGTSVVAFWSPDPDGSGQSSSNPYEFEPGDIIKFKKSGSDSVSVTTASGFLNSSPGSLSTSFVSKTVQSTGGVYSIDYSITYSDGGFGGGGGGFGGGN